MNKYIVEIDNLTKQFENSGSKITVLKEILQMVKYSIGDLK